MKNFSDVYRSETEMCRKLSQKKRGCNWGQCEQCGVIPLLHKLETGEVLEQKEDIKNLKNKILIN